MPARLPPITCNFPSMCNCLTFPPAMPKGLPALPLTHFTITFILCIVLHFCLPPACLIAKHCYPAAPAHFPEDFPFGRACLPVPGIATVVPACWFPCLGCSYPTPLQASHYPLLPCPTPSCATFFLFWFMLLPPCRSAWLCYLSTLPPSSPTHPPVFVCQTFGTPVPVVVAIFLQRLVPCHKNTVPLQAFTTPTPLCIAWTWKQCPCSTLQEGCSCFCHPHRLDAATQYTWNHHLPLPLWVHFPTTTSFLL